MYACLVLVLRCCIVASVAGDHCQATAAIAPVQAYSSCRGSVQVLQPAIELAEDGFPVSPLTARQWARSMSHLRKVNRPLICGCKASFGGHSPLVHAQLHAGSSSRSSSQKVLCAVQRSCVQCP